MEAAFALRPEVFVLALLFASVRTAAALALLPAMGGQFIPLKVRIGLAGAVGLLVMGRVPPPADMLGFPGLLAVAGEILIGATIALSLTAAFAAAGIAGEWLAQAMGLGFATMVQPGAPASPVIGMLTGLLMWALFLLSGGHLLLIRLIVESYAAMPDASALLRPDRIAHILGWGGFALASGVIVAMPLAIALLLVNIGLAVAARSAPQLNLFSIGFPLMLLAGLAGLPLALPGIADGLQGALSAMQQKAAEAILG